MSTFSVKSLFENKNTVVAFNAATKSFQIEDNAKWQILFLRILMLFNGGFMIMFFLRLEYDTISYFLLFFGILSIIVFVITFFKSSSDSHIHIDVIKHVNYKSGKNPQVSIKLENGRTRNLYLFQKEAATVIIDLFKNHDLVIIEKKSRLL